MPFCCYICYSRCFVAKFLPQFTRFHVEKNWAIKYICGEKWQIWGLGSWVPLPPACNRPKCLLPPHDSEIILNFILSHTILREKNTIRDGGSTALWTAFTAYTTYNAFTACTAFIAFAVANMPIYIVSKKETARLWTSPPFYQDEFSDVMVNFSQGEDINIFLWHHCLWASNPCQESATTLSRRQHVSWQSPRLRVLIEILTTTITSSGRGRWKWSQNLRLFVLIA